MGNDVEGSGSAVRPFKTLAHAFALAKEMKVRVIACAESYDETLVLLDGVSAYGYYDCTTAQWTRVTRRAVVQSKTSPALTASGITLPTRIDGFELVAPDAEPGTTPAGSSIGMVVRASTNLVFGEVLLHAGKPGDGADGAAAPVNTHLASPIGKNGDGRGLCDPFVANCNYATGPSGPSGACTVESAGPGGKGGNGSWYVDQVRQNQVTACDGSPAVATTQTAKGGVGNANGSTGLIGGAVFGANGATGANGTNGANGAWQFDVEGFVAGGGTPGTKGSPGQGAGGGGGSVHYLGDGQGPGGNGLYATAKGSAGGAGGCPGQVSMPGAGGGASIGALVYTSFVRFEKSRIETSKGGRAGRGFLGGPGIAGGAGGSTGIAYAGTGGTGGSGGSAGYSGHGAPGPSLAIAFSGVKPTLDDQVVLAPGEGGDGWPDETDPVNAFRSLPGVQGMSVDEHEIKP
jgi:hypothetical protein